jgi:hypothetical protein
MAEYEAKLAARDAKTAATDKKPGGKPPQPHEVEHRVVKTISINCHLSMSVD